MSMKLKVSIYWILEFIVESTHLWIRKLAIVCRDTVTRPREVTKLVCDGVFFFLSALTMYYLKFSQQLCKACVIIPLIPPKN